MYSSMCSSSIRWLFHSLHRVDKISGGSFVAVSKWALVRVRADNSSSKMMCFPGLGSLVVASFGTSDGGRRALGHLGFLEWFFCW
jgi:hypothetical protein